MRAGRRQVLVGILGAAAAGWLPVRAQPTSTAIGVLTPDDAQWDETAFRDELRRLGARAEEQHAHRRRRRRA